MIPLIGLELIPLTNLIKLLLLITMRCRILDVKIHTVDEQLTQGQIDGLKLYSVS